MTTREWIALILIGAVIVLVVYLVRIGRWLGRARKIQARLILREQREMLRQKLDGEAPLSVNFARMALDRLRHGSAPWAYVDALRRTLIAWGLDPEDIGTTQVELTSLRRAALIREASEVFLLAQFPGGDPFQVTRVRLLLREGGMSPEHLGTTDAALKELEEQRKAERERRGETMRGDGN